VGTEPDATVTEDATMIDSGSHVVAVFVPVGAIDWGADVRVAEIVGLADWLVVISGRLDGLVITAVLLVEPMNDELLVLIVAFEGAVVVANPVELKPDVVGNPVADAEAEAVELDVGIEVGAVVVADPRMLDRILPRPTDDVVVVVDEVAGRPSSEESQFSALVVAVEVPLAAEVVEAVPPPRIPRRPASDVVEVPLAVEVVEPVPPPRIPRRPASDAVEVVVCAAVAEVVVAAEAGVPVPSRPLRSSPNKLSLLEVEVVVDVELAGVVTTPDGPKVMPEDVWVEV
jgi:hypothetical protein